MASSAESVSNVRPESLRAQYESVRSLTVALTSTLMVEDTVVQSMPDVSPTKWHLAHVTWFFERFILEAHVPDYQVFDERFDFLLNSYFYTAGRMYARPQRGLLSRPTLVEVLDYRKHVDDAMAQLLSERDEEEEIAFLTTVGIHHEQQHHELILTDIKHVFSCNPMKPAVNAALPLPPTSQAAELAFTNVAGGVTRIGASNEEFCFDNETPLHDALLHDHRIANRLVTNGEFLEFINAGAYSEAGLWLSDGWAMLNENKWDRPLYWDEELTQEFTLSGMRDIDLNAPVSHVNYYEADAFARWAGARLPTEFEWEHAAAEQTVNGNLLDSGLWHPASSDTGAQYFGDVWEWTLSPYAPYPGFKRLDGILGESNGKFMCNQMTVRGGSCITSRDHIRASYRSFFYPHQRWQFLGFRLAKDEHG